VDAAEARSGDTPSKEGIAMHKFLYALIIMTLAVSGCTAGGPKYVDLTYVGDTDARQSGKVGICTFSDLRPDTGVGYVGTRYLNKKDKETYYAYGDNLALSVTGICKSYLQDTGFDCTSIPNWAYTPEGVRDAGQRFDFIIGGEIRKLECFAMKKIGFTSMTLDIDLVIYVGDPGRAELKTMPVILKLERTEMTFSEEKLQKFLNESLLEIIQKALNLEG
jgi:hypothetical protein